MNNKIQEKRKNNKIIPASHGGDIYRNQVMLDFSVNTNPLGMPKAVKASAMLALEQCNGYPDPYCQELREAIGALRHVESEQVLCGNGASELFMGITRAILPKAALVMAPTFSGYEYALAAVGSRIEYAYLKEETEYAITQDFLSHITEEIDMVFLCNPNNPTGVVIDQSLLKAVIAKCKECNVYLVVDQCFLAMTGRYEELCAEQFLPESELLIIVNAFTKTYACAGLRLGYLIAKEQICERIRPQLSEWNVSIPAFAAGLTACREQKYVMDSVDMIRQERGYLLEKLTKMGITCYHSEANYLLLRTELPLYDVLKDQGILIRHCENYHGLSDRHYRIAVKSHAENRMLVEEISHVLEDYALSSKGNTESEKKENITINDGKIIKENQMDPEKQMDQKNQMDPEKQMNPENQMDSEKQMGQKNQMNIRKDVLEIAPLEIEKLSFETISEELSQIGIVPEDETASILKRVIHTSADFEYVNTLTFSKDAVKKARKALLAGATIITDTNMALSGIHKKTLEKLGGKAVCFMADPEVARIAKERGVTRATVSMEFASRIEGPCIFAIGNAPTALVQLYDMIKAGQIHPELIIGVPVGFVNVVVSKELIMETDIPYIINRGRKGGSNVAAAICNALLYQIDNER